MIQRPAIPGHVKRRQLYQMFFFLLEAYVGYAEYNQPELYESRKKQLMQYVREYANSAKSQDFDKI